MSILDKNIYFCVLKADTWSSVKEPTKAIAQKPKKKIRVSSPESRLCLQY